MHSPVCSFYYCKNVCNIGSGSYYGVNIQCASGVFQVVNDKKAHWYRVFNPADDEMDCTIMKSTFLSLATLMLMNESYMIELFLHLGFVKWRSDRTRGYVIYPCYNSWDNFIKKFLLDLELTMVKQRNKKNHLYICCGTWSISHTPRPPTSIWREVLASSAYPIPKLHIATAAVHFAAAIGELFTPEYDDISATSSFSSSGDDGSSQIDSDDENTSSDSETCCCSNNPFDSIEYPLLNHLRLNLSEHPIQNQLVHEVLKYNGGSALHYIQKTTVRGCLSEFHRCVTPNSIVNT